MAAHRKECLRLTRVTTALTPIGVTMEVRAISSVISAVRCRGRMFLSRPLKVAKGFMHTQDVPGGMCQTSGGLAWLGPLSSLCSHL
jgi:hypothetical protein